MIAQIWQDIVYCTSYTFKTLEEAYKAYPVGVAFREIPDDIPAGTGYDLETDSLVANDILVRHRENEMTERKMAVDTDYLEALKAIRKGDASKDWEAKATAIEAYLDALDAVKEQKGYPISVEWPTKPEYPTKP